jgi:hypothetical protein
MLVYSTEQCPQRTNMYHSCRGKAIFITYSECVSVASVIRNVQGTCCIILSVGCMAVTYFSTLTHKLHACRE